MLQLPERFGLNEWFTLAAAVLAMGVALALPKRFSPVEITAYTVFTVYLSQTVDSLIAVAPFDFYDVNDTPKIEWFDMIIYYFCYPPTTYVFLYFYDKWQVRGWKRVGYVIGYSLLSMLLEGAADLFGVFTYKGWKLYDSFFVYVGVYIVYILVYKMVRSLLSNKDNGKLKGIGSERRRSRERR